MADSWIVRSGRRPVASRIIVRRWIRLPVIVLAISVSVSVVQFENRIGQRVGHAEVRQRGSDRTHNDGGVLRPPGLR